LLLFKIAARIGKTVSELERELNYRELLEWAEYFNYELSTFEKSDYYLAQIACTIAQSVAAKGTRFRINDFLVKFEEEKAEKLEPKELAQRVCSWFGIST